MQVSIEGLNRFEIVQALYNGSRVLGMGWHHAKDGKLSDADAQECVERFSPQFPYVDYLNGRIMKISFRTFSDGYICCRLYDRDNGGGAGARAIKKFLSERSTS